MYRILLLSFLMVWFSDSASGDLISPTDFSVFAVHPDASEQQTVRGQTIRDLVAFRGSLYTGYGDWGLDTGPIHVRALDPSSGSWTSRLVTLNTEAVSHFRNISGTLYAVSVDPLGVGVQSTNIVGSSTGDLWGFSQPIGATHVFDINQTPDGDLWVVGSKDTSAVVWRSTDGGSTFQIERQVLPPVGSSDIAFSRYVGAAVYRGNLVVQRADLNTVHNPESQFFDGSEWHSSADLLSEGTGYMTRPEEFLDSLVYLSSDLSNGSLYRFDGVRSEIAIPGTIHDFQILNGRLIALAQGGELWVTTDLEVWGSIGRVDPGVRSFEFFDDGLYLGTLDARILMRNSKYHFSAVPEPGALICIVVSALGLLHRRRY